MLRRIKFWALTMVVVVGGLRASAVAAPTALELERNALAARQELRSGRLKIHASRWSATDGDDRIVEFEYDIVFDGERIRFDRRQSVLHAKGESVEMPPPDKYLGLDDRCMLYSDTLSTSGRITAVTIQETRGTAYRVPVFKGAQFDPRLLGVMPSHSAVLYGLPIEEFLGRADRVKSVVREEKVNGERVWRIDNTYRPGIKARMWIAPRQSFGLVRAEAELLGRTHSIQCKLRQDAASGLWFPESVVYQERLKNKVIMEEVLTVEEAEFNVDIDADVFTMAAMDMPSGTYACEIPPNPFGGRIWNGRKLVPADALTIGAIGWTGWLAISLCSVVAAALLGVFYWRWRASQ